MITLHIESGHSVEEWEERFQQEEVNPLWDFSLDDVFNGAIEPNDDMLYWYINGRIYETTILL